VGSAAICIADVADGAQSHLTLADLGRQKSVWRGTWYLLRRSGLGYLQ
jgi:hypothetical protein